MDKPLHILAFTHNQARVALVQHALATSELVAELHTAASCDVVYAALTGPLCDCLLLDAGLPQHDVQNVLDACASSQPHVAVVVLASQFDQAFLGTTGPAAQRLLLEELTPMQLMLCVRNALLLAQASVFHAALEHEMIAGRSLALLAEISQVLDATDDCSESLPVVAHRVVAAFADWCAIDVLAGTEEPVRLAWAARVPDVYASNETAAGADLAHHDAAITLRMPLIARGMAYGTILFGRITSSVDWTPAERLLAKEIGGRVAATLRTAVLQHTTDEAIHARDAFLSVVAHELKTPLTALLGYATLLQRRVSRSELQPDRDLRGITVMVEQAQRLSKLVNTLLDLSRMSHGMLKLEYKTFNLAELVNRVAQQIEPTLQQNTLYVDAADHVMVPGDPDRLELVVRGLVQNAVKYSPLNGAIRVRLAVSDEWATIAVQDHGAGIGHARLPYIFGRFNHASRKQLHTATALGVGLYMAKHIVELHGGAVDVQSTEGAGSTFTVRLPLTKRPTASSHSSYSSRSR